MNKVNSSKSKPSLITVLSMGFIILGIGCIIWTVFNILTQTHYFATNGSSHLFSNVKVDETSLLESTPYLVTPPPDKVLYPVYPGSGDNIGSLTIPALKRILPLFQGTDDNQLKKGVGHFTQSVLPGEKDNCVISGHRDTVFRQLGDLKIGDQLILETSAGKFTYEVTGTRIVHADDKTIIVPTDHAVLTMTTCYPFYAIGNAPDRYIVSADLVNFLPPCTFNICEVKKNECNKYMAFLVLTAQEKLLQLEF